MASLTKAKINVPAYKKAKRRLKKNSPINRRFRVFNVMFKEYNRQKF